MRLARARIKFLNGPVVGDEVVASTGDGAWKRSLRALSSSSSRAVHHHPRNDDEPHQLASLSDHLRLSRLIREFETNGHFAADVDPLGLARHVAHGKQLRVDSLRKESHGFMDADLKKVFHTGDEPALANFHGRAASLSEILRELEGRYAGAIGVEFAHMANPKKVDWVRRNLILGREEWLNSRDKQMRRLQLLCQAQAFEEYCSNKFSAATHFSLEGGEALIPGLEAILERAAIDGVQAVEMGMAHRGRLNVLRNILNIPISALLDRFESYLDDEAGLPNNSDDVRYHLGASVLRQFHSKTIRVSLAANPSHLEAVNGVLLGKARARQFLMSRGEAAFTSMDVSPTEESRRKVMPLLLHGDASFFQGSVRECLGFSNLRDYTTGGTVHLIVNNQIGFTTLPKQAHSGTYCSDVAKSVGAPIFHVNADHPDEVARVCESAVRFRQTFLSDVVINLWCYRRRGHNQKDAPEITQPLMYHEIKKHEPVSRKYAQALKVNAEDHLQSARREIEDAVWKDLGQLNGSSSSTATNGNHRPLPPPPSPSSGASSSLLPLNRASSLTVETVEDEVRLTWNERQVKDIPEHSVEVLDAFGQRDETKSGFPLDLLREIGKTMFTIPAHFKVNPKVATIFDRRLRSVLGEESGSTPKVRWDCAEQLALGSLMIDGVDCRLAGQDVERGTFNQRHAVLYSIDPQTGEELQHHPWTELVKANLQGRRPVDRRCGVMGVCNSPLSEESVLGFEHGYSLYSFSILGIWEAQFGDFANCAQTVIDTFIMSGEEKWVRQSGIVLSLPHGFEGQGPDHSSAFMERFLTLASEDDSPAEFSREDDPRLSRKSVNVHIVNPTTPAQYFHCLRRHMIAPFRKPLVIFTPKFLLHHGPCASPLADFGPERGSFKVVIGDDTKELSNGETPSFKRIVLCSGKMYYHLAEERERRKLTEKVALVRVEQLCPFPFGAVQRELVRLCGNNPSALPRIVWAQEEPKNRGAWGWIQPRLNWVLSKTYTSSPTVQYIGRPTSASPATGSYKKHRKELQKLIDRVLTDD